VDGRDKPGHDGSGSSRDLPRGAILGVFEHDAHLCEFVADAIGFCKVPCFASHPAIRAWLGRMAALPHWKPAYELLPGKRMTNYVT